jgi:diguanylate cyclase (GGDEF)-like protein
MSHGASSRLTNHVGTAILFVGVVAIVLFCANVLRVAASVDERALDRDAGALRNGLRLLSELTAAESIGLSSWTEAYRNTTTDPSRAWMRKNLGRSVYSEPQDQRLAVVDPAGSVTFESSIDGPPRPREAGAILVAAAPLLRQLGQAYRAARADEDGLDRRHGDGLVEGLYVHGFARLDDRPVLIVASPFLPDADAADFPARPAVLLDIRHLTPGLLSRLGAFAHLDGVRTGSPADAPVQVLDPNGGFVTALAWDHVPPGSVVLRSMQPAFLGSIGLVAALALSMGHVLRRRTRALAESEQAALFASRHDGPTGLANRRWFMEELARATCAPGHPALVLIDCDYFKAVNDTLGHAAGDAVLKAVAERLQALDGSLRLAGRLGGDEFAAITRDLAGPDDMAMVADLVSEVLMRPVDFEGRRIPVSVSIGAVRIAGGEGGDAAVRMADAALYRAKRDGRGCWRIFDAALDGAAGSDAEEAALTRDPRAGMAKAA